MVVVRARAASKTLGSPAVGAGWNGGLGEGWPRWSMRRIRGGKAWFQKKWGEGAFPGFWWECGKDGGDRTDRTYKNG